MVNRSEPTEQHPATPPPRAADLHVIEPAGRTADNLPEQRARARAGTLPAPLRAVLEGHLVLLKGGLAHLGAWEPLRQQVRAALDEHLPHGTAADRPLEELHRHADTALTVRIRTDLETRIRPLARTMLRDFTTALTPQPGRVYLSDHLGVRIMPPRSSLAPGGAPDGLAGFLTPRDAHVDSWFNTPVNSINLWIALTRVERGNGLLFHPDAYRRPLRHDGWDLLPGQDVGDPVDVAMDAQDVLLFAGDHLHASQPNDTDATRIVLTKRLCLGPPRYPRHGTGWVPYHDPRLSGLRWEPLTSWRSRLTTAGLRHALHTVTGHR